MNWHFSPKKMNNTGSHNLSSMVENSQECENSMISKMKRNDDHDKYEDSSSMSSETSKVNDSLPPILAHMSGDPVALRKWASLASSELRALKLGKKHSDLQISCLINENERLRHELLLANIAKSQVCKKRERVTLVFHITVG